MKKIRSILAFALALSMCASMAACGSNSNDESSKTETSSAATTEATTEEATEAVTECEEAIKDETTATTRCMPFEQEHLSDVCVHCGKPAKKMVYFGKAY